MQDVIPFAYEGSAVRVAQDSTRGPLFVLADICSILSIGNSRAVASRLDDDMKGVSLIDTPGGRQQMTVVTESGMYDVIVRSDSPKAKPFRRWVTREVLPSIRKRGGYLTPEATEAALTDPDFIIRLATSLKEERAKTAALAEQVEADKPKVLFADSVAASKSTILVGELAKILKGNGIDIGGTRLFEQLRQDGYLIKRQGSDRNMPTQRSMELGLFEIKETAVTHSDGHVTISKTPKVTGKGQAYFINLYKKVAA